MFVAKGYLDEHLHRASALGLMEIIPSEEVLYRIPRILAPLLESQQPAQPRQRIQTACSTLHDIWWQNAEDRTEERMLEIHRLALLSEQPEIALGIGNQMTAAWHKQCRYHEGERLCSQTMALAETVLDGQDHIGPPWQHERHRQSNTFKWREFFARQISAALVKTAQCRR